MLPSWLFFRIDVNRRADLLGSDRLVMSCRMYRGDEHLGVAHWLSFRIDVNRRTDLLGADRLAMSCRNDYGGHLDAAPLVVVLDRCVPVRGSLTFFFGDD